jgi:hypothetical protein
MATPTPDVAAAGRTRPLAVALAAVGVAALVVAGALAARTGPRRLWTRIIVSRADVAECERVRDVVIAAFDGARVEEVVERLVAVVPPARLALVEAVQWTQGGLAGHVVFSIGRCAVADPDGPWDERAAVANLAAGKCSDESCELTPTRRRADDAFLRLAAGPLAPIAATVTPVPGRSPIFLLTPVQSGTRLFAYTFRDGARSVRVAILRP